MGDSMKISNGNTTKDVKAIYIGNEKVWSKKDGEISTELKKYIELVSGLQNLKNSVRSVV